MLLHLSLVLIGPLVSLPVMSFLLIIWTSPPSRGLDISTSLSPPSALGAQRMCWRRWSAPLTFTACALQGPQRPPPWSRRFPPALQQGPPRCPPVACGSTTARPRLFVVFSSANAAGGTRCTPSTQPSAWLLRRRRSAAALWFSATHPTSVSSRCTERSANAPAAHTAALFLITYKWFWIQIHFLLKVVMMHAGIHFSRCRRGHLLSRVTWKQNRYIFFKTFFLFFLGHSEHPSTPSAEPQCLSSSKYLMQT